MRVVSGCLDNHHGLLRKEPAEVIEGLSQIGDGAVPHRIVAEADNIVVDTTIAQLTVIVTGDVPVAGLLSMDDNL